MHGFQGYYPRTFHVLELSRKKIQDFSGGVGTLYSSHVVLMLPAVYY